MLAFALIFGIYRCVRNTKFMNVLKSYVHTWYCGLPQKHELIVSAYLIPQIAHFNSTTKYYLSLTLTVGTGFYGAHQVSKRFSYLYEFSFETRIRRRSRSRGKKEKKSYFGIIEVRFVTDPFVCWTLNIILKYICIKYMLWTM